MRNLHSNLKCLKVAVGAIRNLSAHAPDKPHPPSEGGDTIRALCTEVDDEGECQHEDLASAAMDPSVASIFGVRRQLYIWKFPGHVHNVHPSSGSL